MGGDDDDFDNTKNYAYLLHMPIFSLTLEQKQKLLKEKGTVQAQMANLKNKTPLDLWRADLSDFLSALDTFEKELKDEEAEADAKVHSKTKKKGKRSNTITLQVDPSLDGERVQPTITDKMKKDAAPKVKKEAKPKNTKKRTSQERAKNKERANAKE